MNPIVRFVSKDARVYEHSLCRLCGVAAHSQHNYICQAATCLACGAVQCGGHETCRVCYHGLTDYYSPHKCGYGCGRQAVVKVPRVHYACGDCAQARAPKVKAFREKLPIAQVVARYAERALEDRGPHLALAVVPDALASVYDPRWGCVDTIRMLVPHEARVGNSWQSSASPFRAGAFVNLSSKCTLDLKSMARA